MVEAKVCEILVDVLGVDNEEVVADANLVDDLAAESIDFVDITYSLEQEFDIKINPGDIFPAFLKDVELHDAATGKLTEEVKTRLSNEYPHFLEDTITEFETSKDPNVFFKVGSLVDFINLKTK